MNEFLRTASQDSLLICRQSVKYKMTPPPPQPFFHPTQAQTYETLCI